MPAPRTHHPQRFRRGVTLVEVLLVAIVVAFVATLTVPKISARAYRADAEARHTQAVLQLAQRLAVTSQHDVVVSFDSTHHRIRIADDANGDAKLDRHERQTWHSLEYGLRFAIPANEGRRPSRAIQGANLQIVDGMPSVTFRANGSATSDVHLYLGSTHARRADFRVVAVAAATGEVVYDHLPEAISQAATN